MFAGEEPCNFYLVSPMPTVLEQFSVSYKGNSNFAERNCSCRRHNKEIQSANEESEEGGEEMHSRLAGEFILLVGHIYIYTSTVVQKYIDQVKPRQR